MYLASAYRDQMPIMQELHRLREASQLSEAQALWFQDSKPPEQLFDVDSDPHELNDLAQDPDYAEKLAELRVECERWVAEIDDTGLIPEKDLIDQQWPGMVQPLTAIPVGVTENGKTSLSCTTEGASIGYKFIINDIEAESWMVYTEPFEPPAGAQVKAIAHRLGYKISEEVILE